MLTLIEEARGKGEIIQGFQQFLFTFPLKCSKVELITRSAKYKECVVNIYGSAECEPTVTGVVPCR
jgi:hypothetical protein